MELKIKDLSLRKQNKIYSRNEFNSYPSYTSIYNMGWNSLRFTNREAVLFKTVNCSNPCYMFYTEMTMELLYSRGGGAIC